MMYELLGHMVGRGMTAASVVLSSSIQIRAVFLVSLFCCFFVLSFIDDIAQFFGIRLRLRDICEKKQFFFFFTLLILCVYCLFEHCYSRTN